LFVGHRRQVSQQHRSAEVVDDLAALAGRHVVTSAAVVALYDNASGTLSV
jgi:hypothetical protein